MARVSDLDHKYAIVASDAGYEDFIDLLEVLAKEARDVGTDIGPDDSVETRKAISIYLRRAIDKIRSMRKNKLNRSSGTVNDDV